MLPILNALVAERNVSRAAKQLGLTQSAVSHALTRLRRELGDDLFVRAARGVVPTPFMLDLAPRLASLMESLHGVYQRDQGFDPRRAKARLTIATTDYIEAIVFPKLLEILQREAPDVLVVTRPAAGSLPKAELESGVLDLAVAGYFGDVPEGLYTQKLFVDHFRSAVRRDHPVVVGGDKVSVAAFAALEHILISPQGDMRAVLDQELAKLGHQRRVVAGIGSFLSPAWMISASDRVLTALSRLLATYAAYFPLALFDTPVPLPTIRVVQVWHERTHRSPLHRWFRGVFEEAAR